MSATSDPRLDEANHGADWAPHAARRELRSDFHSTAPLQQAANGHSASPLDAQALDDQQAPAEIRDLRLNVAGRRRGRAFALTDLAAATLAVPIALVLLAFASNVEADQLSHFWSNIEVDWLFPLMVLAAFAISGFYRSARRSLNPSSFREIKDLAFAVGTGAVLALAAGLLAHRLLGTPEPAASQIVTSVLVAVLLITAARAALRAMRQAVGGSRIVLVGKGELMQQIEAYLGLQKGNQVIGHVIDSEKAEPSDLDDPGCLGTLADLPHICEEHHVERVVIGFPSAATPETVAILRSLQGGVKMALVPRYFELISWRSTLTDLYGLPLLEVAAPHISQWDRFIKRSLDLVVSGLALTLLAPIMLLIGIAVRATSHGSTLFRQVRVGRDKRPFTIYKFRTMTSEPGSIDPFETRQCAEAGAGAEVRSLFEVRRKFDDRERVTRLGAFLRRTSLDEIPQFWNVLRGDMSLVGPRPFVPHESDDLTGWSSVRFQVRPGITGLWQVSGRNNLSVEDLRRLDYLYVSSWSFSEDIKILWETPRTMFRGYGAC